MRITKKAQLVELLSELQVICLTVALLGGAFWVRSSVHEIMRNQVMGDNQLIATQMSKLIRKRPDISTIEFGNQSWDELQTLIEDVSLPNEGYMCVADAEDGSLLCHPKIRSNPQLRGANVLGRPIIVDDRAIPLKHAFDRNTNRTFTGIAGNGNSTEVVSVATLPKLGSVLLVHQSEAGFRKAVNLVLIPIGLIALIVGLVLILVTKKASVGVLNRYENKIAEINEGLEETVRIRTVALTKTRDAVIFGLAKLSESRDNDTGEHLERISSYATILAKHLTNFVRVDQQLIDDIGLASSLHDIGKVGVPDQVLLKPGRLTPQERRIIEVHPRIGQECLQAISDRLGEDNFLSLATEICAFHHEKWDGSGYPNGLAETEIPLSARIVAVADVYDALRSRRPYKDPMPHSEARAVIFAGRGAHFDPTVVDAFLLADREFEALSEQQHAQPVEEKSSLDELREAVAF
ncbi:MAG: HD domain-containing phosphohydrolase [Planctomycetota bacterium]